MSEPICSETGAGLVLPIFGKHEQKWPQGLRIAVYCLGLGYCFMGVAIIADVFMGAIEKVTSKKIRRKDPETGKDYTFEVWNPTVANLSLMALGSSAPEILLNVIDIFAKEYYLEGLGPSTIVGSAAFNLLMIIAVCVASIPSGEVRYIKEMSVYVVTAVWSVFAYIWLLVILTVITPNVVDVWEGIVTFLFFPVLCFLAFSADKGWCCFAKGEDQVKLPVLEEMSQEQLLVEEAKVREEHGGGLSDEQVARILAAMYPKQPTRATYRIEATRRMFGGKRVKLGPVGTLKKSISQQMSFLARGSTKKVVPIDDEPATSPKHKKTDICPAAHKLLPCNLPANKEMVCSGCDAPLSPGQQAMGCSKCDWYMCSRCAPLPKADCFIEFEHSRKVVMENKGEILIHVLRTGDLNCTAEVSYKTKDGEAKVDQDYKHAEGTLHFEPGEKVKQFKVFIIDDIAYESDEDFFVELHSPTAQDGKVAQLGSKAMMTIVIIDDDEPGMFAFQKDEMRVSQQASADNFQMEIIVERRKAATGEVTVKYRTEADTAVPDRDFVETEGTLTFIDKQAEASIFVTIIRQGRYESTDRFRVILEEPQGGAKLDPNTDGGEDRCYLTVTIEADREAKDRIDRLKSHLQVKWDKSKVGHSNWASQFKAAFFVNGGEEDDDDDENSDPSCFDRVMHWIAVPWKLLFALVPPTDFCDGWLCLGCSLGMIGVVTLIIGETASLLGCVLCISDDITAITFVALGTSLPDTFASRTAAVQDPHADASVGNVTGSNSVNVFLGLGLPWMIASIHWAVNQDDDAWFAKYRQSNDALGFNLDSLGADPLTRMPAFVVEAGSLSFSVAVFSSCAIVCLMLLAIRRVVLGGELGGPPAAKWGTAIFLVGLWLVYIGLSIWMSLRNNENPGCITPMR